MSVYITLDQRIVSRIESIIRKYNNQLSNSFQIIIGHYKGKFSDDLEEENINKLRQFLDKKYEKKQIQPLSFTPLEFMDIDLTQYNVRFQLSSITQDSKSKEISTIYNNKGDKYYFLLQGNSISILFEGNSIDIKDVFQPLKLILYPISKTPFLISFNERKEIINTYNTLIGKTGKNPVIIFNKPYNLKRSDLGSLENYLIFPKLDGIRYFLFLLEDNAFLINNTEFLKVSMSENPDNTMTLIDGELIDGKYYPFDLLFYKGKDVRQNTRMERLELIKKIKVNGIEIKIIDPMTDFKKGFDKYFKAENTDGVILAPNNMPYFNTKTFKYKPQELQVIDFFTKKEKLDVGDVYGLYVKGEKGDLVLFKGTPDQPFGGYVSGTERDKKMLDKGGIIEFKWEFDRFIPVRIRTDKTQPNFIEVAYNIWEEINDPITEEEFLASIKKKDKDEEKVPVIIPEIKEVKLSTLPPVKMLPVNESVTFYTPFEDFLIRTGTIGEGSCLFHSILFSTSKKYRDMNVSDRKNYVKKLRKTIAKSITVEKWMSLADGMIAFVPYQVKFLQYFQKVYKFIVLNNKSYKSSAEHVFEEFEENFSDLVKKYKNILSKHDIVYYESDLIPYIFKIYPYVINNVYTNLLEDLTPKILQDFGDDFKENVEPLLDLLQVVSNISAKAEYDKFIEEAENCREWAGQYLIGYVSDVLNRDIYFVNGNTRLPYTLGGSVDYKNRKSVIVCFTEESHFESIGILQEGKKVKRDFDPSHPFIKKLYQFLFDKESFKRNYPELKEFLPKESR